MKPYLQGFLYCQKSVFFTVCGRHLAGIKFSRSGGMWLLYPLRRESTQCAGEWDRFPNMLKPTNPSHRPFQP